MIKEGNVKMTAKEFYETIGQNYEEVLERLAGSEALVLRFLKKFSTVKPSVSWRRLWRPGILR